MKKKRRILKRIINITICLMCICTIISPFINTMYAKTNSAIGVFGGTQEGATIMQGIMGASTGVLGSALSAVILLIIGLLYLILCSIFGPMLGTWGFPGIDQIIFNGVYLFDPNFINPDKTANDWFGNPMTGQTPLSLVANPAIGDFIKQVYQSGFAIGGSIFVIGAMIIGIKLAVSSIATEKAYYKEMIGQWLKGLVLLFTVHIIVAAMFSLNEVIVEQLYISSEMSTLVFSTTIEMPGTIGKLMSGLTTIINTVLGTEIAPTITLNMPGLNGLVLGLIARAVINGDIVAGIAVAGLLGQTVSLMITYFKRCIVCIALAVIAPYIVAIDFIKQLF